MKFDRDAFQNGEFRIQCLSQLEAEKAVQLLYDNGFTWHPMTGLTRNDTQYDYMIANHETEHTSIFYGASEYEENIMFWATYENELDEAEDGNVHEWIHINSLVPTVHLEADELLKILI